MPPPERSCVHHLRFIDRTPTHLHHAHGHAAALHTHLPPAPPAAAPQAALVSMAACTLGAAIPLLSGAFVQDDQLRVYCVMVATAIGCLMFGVTASALGGAGITRGGLRVLAMGTGAMGITFAVGRAFGVVITGR
jgi:VIT1/CCC1 family predicted Fe2+/Mn2+ transporter